MSTKTRVSFAYLQSEMPETAVCAVCDVWFRDYLVWRLRGWVKSKPAPMAIGEYVSGFMLTEKGRNVDLRPLEARCSGTLQG